MLKMRSCRPEAAACPVWLCPSALPLLLGGRSPPWGRAEFSRPFKIHVHREILKFLEAKLLQ